MKSIEKVLEVLLVVATIVFVLAMAAMVLGQAVCVVTLNGAGSVYLSDLISDSASRVSAVATIIAIILGYIRGQMKS